MEHNRKAVVFSALGMIATLMSAAGAAVTTNRRLPEPPCGDYVECTPKPKPWETGPIFRPMDALNAKTAAITGAIGDKNMDKASEGLENLFSGAGSKSGRSGAAETESGAVYAGDWTGTKSYPGLPSSVSDARGAYESAARRAVPRPELGVGTLTTSKKPKMSAYQAAEVVGGAVVGEIIRRGIDAAEKALDRYADRDQTQESKEKYGGCRMNGTCDK